ncbi:hypothetical protein [Amycolatopsis sp. NPDC059657]|uniref:hypothetical protein n=1 Tax=Amycolatopsis sp. NPDC059657 TaxID=3346899 RepID=UPI00366C1223
MKSAKFTVGVLGLLCVIQGIGGLIQRMVKPDYHGWYLVLYLSDGPVFQIVGSIILILLGSFLLHITRNQKQSSENSTDS